MPDMQGRIFGEVTRDSTKCIQYFTRTNEPHYNNSSNGEFIHRSYASRYVAEELDKEI